MTDIESDRPTAGRRWRMRARRVLAVLAFLALIAAALVAGLVAPYLVAASSANIALLVLIAVATFAVLAFVAAGVAQVIWCRARTIQTPAATAVVLTVIFVVALYGVILRPSRSLGDPVAYDRMEYWQLPTGSRIAYSEYDPPPGVTVRPDPIVFLHGGPGLRHGPFDRDAYAAFTTRGFRVFLFDQAGSGLSDFLPHVRDYTIARSVADLEAIRQKIGAEKMILIGHSWGSTLAASYMAKYPDRVAKVVFHSPGEIWEFGGDTFNASRTAGSLQGGFPSPRFLAALMLRGRNPDAAENLLGQRESEELAQASLLQTVGALVCKGDSGKLPPLFDSLLTEHRSLGFNPYVLQQLASGASGREGDPHAALRANKTPAILLYPECNYLSWAGAVDYRKTLPNLKVYYIPRAGHYIQFEQPELLDRVIEAFLLDQPDVIPPYTSDADPRDSNR